MNKHVSTVLTLGIIALPYVAFAAPQNLRDLIVMVVDLINPLIGLLVGLGVLYFVWNTVQFIAHADEQKAREAGKDGMIYGIIGLFVLFSFWGIVQFLKDSIFN